MADPTDVKLILKASIIANPERTSVKQLYDEFRRNEGFEVPFRNFGFNSFYDYLLSLRDVCLVIGSGPQAEVRAIVTEKSAHVADMISKQRKPTKKGKKRGGFNGRFASQGFRPTYHTKPNYPQRQYGYGYVNRPYYTHNFPQHQEIRPLMSVRYDKPQFNVGTTKRLDGTTHVTNVRPDMKRMCREDESDSDGFEDCEEFMINNLPSTSSRIDNNLSNVSNNSFDASNKIGSCLSNLSNNRLDTSNKIGNSIIPINQTGIVKSSNQSNATTKIGITNGLNAKVDGISDITSKMEDVFISDNEDEVNVNYKVPFTIQQNLRTLIAEYPDGIWCRNMPDFYKTKFGTGLNYSDFGYKSLFQMCTELGYIFNHVQADKGDFKLFDKRLPLSTKEFELLQGFKQFEEAIMNIEPKPKLPAVPDNVVELLCNVSLQYPSQVLTICDHIPVQTVKLTEEEQQFIEIKIAEVFDPSKFWFNLRQFDRELNNLMDEMQVFYDKKWKEYLIPSYMLEVNLYCSIKFLNEYHRALICNMLPETKGQVKAFFIDYGTVSAIRTEGICYLHNSFKELPAQGIRGRLARIRPPLKDNTWSRESATRFLDLIREKPLIAEIDDLDEEANCFSLIVTDTNGEDDIFIGDTLAYEGFATFEFEEQKIDLFIKSIPLVDYIYLYPTFDELEKGEVPSASEMITIIRSGIPYHAIYPHYFEICPDKAETDEESEYSDEENVEDDVKHADEEPINIETEQFEKLLTQSDMSISDLSQTSPLEPSNPEIHNSTQNDEIVEIEQPTEVRPTLRPPPGFEHVQPNANLIQKECQNQQFQNPLWNYEVNTAVYQFQLREAMINHHRVLEQTPRTPNPYLQDVQGYNYLYNNVNNQNFAQYYPQQNNYYQNNSRPCNPNFRAPYSPYIPQDSTRFSYQENPAQARFTNRAPIISCNQTNVAFNQLQNTNEMKPTPTNNVQTAPIVALNSNKFIPMSIGQTCNNVMKPNEASTIQKNTNLEVHDAVMKHFEAPVTHRNKNLIPASYLQTTNEVVKTNEAPVTLSNFFPVRNLQATNEVAKTNEAPMTPRNKIFIPVSNLQTTNEAPVTLRNPFSPMSNQQAHDEVVKATQIPVKSIKPKHVVKTELFKKHFHVFLYKSKPHLLIAEVQKQFFPTITVPKLKKIMITCEIFLDHLIIKNNDVYEELISNGAIDPTATLIDIFLLSDLEDLIKNFSNDKLPLEEFSQFINKFKSAWNL